MSEQWYDEVIAPKVQDIGELCKAKGISFSATVEYTQGEWAETRFIADDAHLTMIMLALVNHHGSSVDGFIIDLVRHCKKHNIPWDESIVMRHFGGTE